MTTKLNFTISKAIWPLGIMSIFVIFLTFSWGDWFFKGICLLAVINFFVFAFFLKNKTGKIILFFNIGFPLLILLLGFVRFMIVFDWEYRLRGVVSNHLEIILQAEKAYKRDFGKYTTKVAQLKLPSWDCPTFRIEFSKKCSFSDEHRPDQTTEASSMIPYTPMQMQIEQFIQKLDCPDLEGKEKFEAFLITDLKGPILDIWSINQYGIRRNIQDGRIHYTQVSIFDFLTKPRCDLMAK